VSLRELSPISGLDWVSALPSNWAIRTIGRDAWVRARLGWRGLTASEYVDEGIPMLSTPNIKNSEIDYAGANRISRERYDESPEIMLRNGDVLLTKDGSTIGTVNVVRRLPGPATANGSIAVLSPGPRIDGRYLYWFLASGYAQSIFSRLRDGMGVPHLFQRDINRIQYPAPPIEEQRAIAGYLDRETAQIDALIEKQERLIATLRERRQSLVADAVYASQQRDTNKRLKHFIRGVRQGWSPQCNSWPADGVESWGVLKAGAANAGRFRPAENKELPESETPRPETVVRRGEILVSRANTRELVGSAAVVDRDLPRLMLCDKLYALAVDSSSADAEYVSLTLGTRRWRDLIELEATGASHSMQNISQADILNLPFAPPSVEEQRSLVNDLRVRSSDVDFLITKAYRLIELSRERRTALITAAVTGQIDVAKGA